MTQASRALNGHSDVAAATIKRAKDAARRLGYLPNVEARRLRMPNSRTNSIGVVLSSESLRLSDPFLGVLLAAIVEQTALEGLELQLSSPLAEAEPISAYERAIQQKRVDGFIVLRTAIDDQRVHFLREQRFPFVTFGRLTTLDDFPVVDECDDSIQPAVDLLVGLGHTHIACLTEPTQYSKATYRLRSFRRAMDSHGLAVEDVDIVEAGFHEEAGFRHASEILRRTKRPSAIVALNDLLAMGVVRAASHLGVDVPGELSVVGFDDVDAASLITPPLTTLRQPLRLVGQLLVEQLIQAIEHGSPQKNERLVVPELVVRESTAPPPPGETV